MRSFGFGFIFIFCLLFAFAYAKNGTLPWDAFASRDRDQNSLYERNRDRANWDVRDNWRYQKRSFLRGDTQIDPNNFKVRRRSQRHEYRAPEERYNRYRPRDN